MKTPPPRMSSSVSAHSCSHVSGSPIGSGTSRSNSSQSSRSTASSASVARLIVHGSERARQEVVRRQVLERMELRAELVHVDTVEIERRLAEHEVAGRPGVRPGEVAREEPLGGPRAEAALRGDRRAHLVVGQQRERVEVDVAPRERDRVLRLAVGEADGEELVLARGGDPRAGRERPGFPDPLAEALDEPVPDRDGGEERHLLRGDRGDERLERVRLERRPEAAQPLASARPSARSPTRRTRSRSNGVPSSVMTTGRVSSSSGLDVDAAGRGRDRDVSSTDRTVEHAVDEPVREVGAERLEAARRERVVVRRWEVEAGYTCEVTPAWSSAAASSAHEYM